MKSVKSFLEKFRDVVETRIESLKISEKDKTFFRHVDHFDKCEFRIDFLTHDTLSYQLLEIVMHSPTLKFSTDDSENIDRICHTVTEKISYLSENLRIIGMDKINNLAQIRSYPPYQSEKQRLFFQAILDFNDGAFILNRRLLYLDSHVMTKTPFVVSREIMERLVADLVDLK